MRVMPFSSDIHTVTYLSKGCADVLGRLFCRELPGFLPALLSAVAARLAIMAN